MPHIGVNLPSGSTALALLPLAFLLLGLVVYALSRLARAGDAPYLPKWLWAALIVLAIPWGAIVYLLLARGTRVAEGADRAPGVASTPPPIAAAATLPAPKADAVPSDHDDPLVSTHGLTRDYGGGAGLFHVDLRVPRGVIYGLVGPNGAGKSTLLSILTGVRHSDSGTVRIGVSRTAIAVCPDVPEFEPWLTAYEVVDLARHYVAPQRLGLAAALVGDPELLLLDEPTSALDPAGRAEILDLVAAMRGRRTVIFSSHILADVQRVADHVGVLRGGMLLYQGDTRTLVDEHLAPRWAIRLSGPVQDVVTKLRAQACVRRVEVVDDGTIHVDADTMRHGEHGIQEVLASCRAGLVACEPLAADLETAFLALTRT